MSGPGGGGSGEDGARSRGRWRRPGLIGVALGAVGILALVLVAVPDPVDEAAGGVTLPDATAGPGAAPAGGRVGSVREPTFECLVEVDCLRWRVDVGEIITEERGAHVQPAGDDLLVAWGPAGIVVLDVDGEPRWSVTDRDLPRPRRVVRPAVAGDLVLVDLADGLLALDLADGSPRWRVASDAPLTPHRAGLVDGSVLVVVPAQRRDPDGPPAGELLRAHDAADGTLRWEREVAWALPELPAFLVDGLLHGAQPATGETLWRADLARAPGEDAAGDVVGALGGAVVGGDHLLVTVAAPRRAPAVWVLDAATGEARHRIDGRLAWHDARAAVVVDRGADGQRARLLGIGADGEVAWERALGSDDACCPEVRGGPASLLLVDGGAFEVVDPRDGRTLSEGELAAGESPASPLGPSTALSQSFENAAATAIDLRDSTPLWRVTHAPVHSHVLPGASLLVAGGELLAVEHDPREPGDRHDD